VAIVSLSIFGPAPQGNFLQLAEQLLCASMALTFLRLISCTQGGTKITRFWRMFEKKLSDKEK